MTFSQGRVLGNKIPGYVRQFLAVPFSASTDGANKWLPPQPRAPWDYVLDCSNWGAGCTQPHHNPDVPKNQSLDCLNVNIFGEFLGVRTRLRAPQKLASTNPTPKTQKRRSNPYLQQRPTRCRRTCARAPRRQEPPRRTRQRATPPPPPHVNPLSQSSGSAVPVLVFFNGGAFMEGSNQGPFGMYNGSRLAQQGVVVVSANYRVGAFGYLATGRGGVAGNFGLMDQVAALQWVQANIAAVGGDPSQVTIFGESAGAMSIGLLLTTDHAKGLFKRAIMESNVAGMNYRNLTEAALIADVFCGQLNCSNCDVACLRDAPVQGVMDAWNSATGNVPVWVLANVKHILDGFLDTGPTRDGAYVPLEPMAAVEAGTWWGKDVDLMLGTNTNECVVAAHSPPPHTHTPRASSPRLRIAPSPHSHNPSFSQGRNVCVRRR